MTEQLDLGVAPELETNSKSASTGKPLTARQQLAFDYVRERSGVSADEVGAFLHAHKDRRPHGVDERCDFCGRDGSSVLRSKALKPLITYRNNGGGRVYLARNPADRIRADQEEQVSRVVPDDPFAGL